MSLNRSVTPSGVVIGLPMNAVVLVVGDLQARAAVERGLAGMVCRLERYDDCASAHQLITTTLLPDLLVVDAGCTGALDLCRRLKVKPSTNALPVILYGGAGTEREARQRAIDAGADHWVTQDLPEAEFRSRSLHLLRARGLFRSLFEVTDNLRMRRDWVRYLVHDLRSPLTVVLANLDYLARALSDSAERATVLQEASFQVQRMNAMLQDMLDMDRIQRGELKLSRSRFELTQVLHQAATNVRLIARERGLELSVEGDHVEVDADRPIVERMIGNLLGNALRYAHRRIALSLDQAEGALHVRVTNDGPGLSVLWRERIFVPFVRLDDHAPPGGAGLGLAFCRLAAIAHGGNIEVEDGADGHVCFRLTLPDGSQKGR